MTTARTGQWRRQGGNVLVEFALVAVLLLAFSLVVFDAGFYLYAFISIQNAARAAAMRNSAGSESADDQGRACGIVSQELSGLSNIGPAFATSCESPPLIVTSALCTAGASCGFADPPYGSSASVVRVTYTLPELFRFPFFSGPDGISRTVYMKVRTLE